jgi:serine protease AprX
MFRNGGSASISRHKMIALATLVLAIVLMGAGSAAAAPAASTAALQPPAITVTIGGKLLPGGQATATVQASGGSSNPTFTYRWQVDGSDARTKSATTSLSDNLSLSGASYGDVVKVTVTPYVGTTAGSPATASAEIVDHAPKATVTLPTAPARPTGSVTAKATAADVDGDHVTLSYTWTVDAVVKRTVANTTNTSDNFSFSGLQAGQVVAVSVVPNDGRLDGAAAKASTSVVETAPTATVVIGGQLNPQSKASATVTTADAEKDAVTLTYVWNVNGTVVRRATSTSTTDQLPLTGFAYGSVVSVEVTPKDSWLTGNAMGDSATMVDRAPVAKVQALKSPTGKWRPTGTASTSATVSDPDNDPNLSFKYVWSVNGVAKQTDAGVAGKTDSFSWAGLPGGSVVTASVIPNDGTMEGATVVSSTTIVETPPAASVTIGGDIRPGGLATAKVAMSDADSDPVSLTYVWSVNGAVERIKSATTNSSDHFGIPTTVQPGAKVSVRVIPNDGYFNGSVSEASATAGTSVTSSTGYDPAADPYSMYDTTLFTGAQAWWDAGETGEGITVAVIDTGVSPVPALSGSGKVLYGPDLSLDSQNPLLANLDSNGHGTFMAGLIAGRDPSLAAPYSSQPATVYRGIAPDAQILSVKVGATDGEVDVTQVIAAIDWVVQHRHDHGMNIRVISLSYGTNSTQSYLIDPLAYAAEQATKAGVVVVAAAGNTGFQQGAGAPGVADPAMDPFVIAVGGFDTMGSYGNNDDRLGDYSASSAGCPAPACKGPDILAAGSHLQGLRDRGSYLDLNHPEGRLSDVYFRGSGTSQATALMAGTIALILQKYPDMTPADVKAFLQAGADKIAGIPDSAQGAGEVDLFNLLDDAALKGTTVPYAASTGTGTIEGSRGTEHLIANNVVLDGEKDIFGAPIDTTSLAAAEATQSSWNGGIWNGNSWSGNSWSASSWSASSWSASSWSGNSWSASSWSGNSWSGSSWSGNSWSSNSWSSNSWSSNSWSGGSWQGATWG